MARTLSWGKPRLFIQKEGETTITELPTPVLDSTTLETTQGDKTEAKVEGGENEAVRYAKSTYALNCNIRISKEQDKPIKDADGLISGTYALILVPEDSTAIGICIDKCTIAAQTTYSTAEGLAVQYTFDALTAAKGDQVKLGTSVVTESSGSVTKVVFTESGTGTTNKTTFGSV